VRPARLAVALLGTAVLCCAPALVRPTESDGLRAAARWQGSGLAELEKGRAVYVARCGKCHELVLPEENAAEDWPRLVGRMSEKAKLAAEDRQLVERFLVTLAERTAERSPGAK
jgi:cytochrome c553